MCLDPQTKNRTVRGNDFEYTHRCGQCRNCRLTQRSERSARALMEKQTAGGGIFATWTYSDKYLPPGGILETGSLRKKDMQDLHKRIRANIERFCDTDQKMRYQAVGEYGVKGRPHYHGNYFYVPLEWAPFLFYRSWSVDIGKPVKHDRRLVRAYPDLFNSEYMRTREILGFVDIKPMNKENAMYTSNHALTKLSTQDREIIYDGSDGRESPFVLYSKRPALGSDFIDRLSVWYIEKKIGFEGHPETFLWGNETRFTKLPPVIHLWVDGKKNKFPLDRWCRNRLISNLSSKMPLELEERLEINGSWRDHFRVLKQKGRDSVVEYMEEDQKWYDKQKRKGERAMRKVKKSKHL